MEEFPFKVTITIPAYSKGKRGRDATTEPNGLVSSIRLPNNEVEVIDRARRITGFDISRGGFIRVSAYRTALEICKHYDEVVRRVKEEKNDSNTGRTVRPPERDEVG